MAGLGVLLALLAGGCTTGDPGAATTAGATPATSGPSGGTRSLPTAPPTDSAAWSALSTGARWSGWFSCGAGLDPYECGLLAVPLARDGSSTRYLTLGVYAGGDLGAARTVVFLTGGPGQGGAGAVERVTARLGGTAAGLRIVFVDQRGTGGQALDCPALQQQLGTSDLTVPSEDAVTACATSIGDDRRHYATTDTVADLEDLRAALGVDRISLDGISYGSYVAQRYAAAHPSRVDRLVLDSVVPMTGFDPLMTEVFPEVTRVLRAVCDASTCRRDPSADLAATVRRWPDLGPGLLDTVTAMSVADLTYPGFLDAVAAGARGDDAPARALVTTWRTEQAAPAESLSQGLHASTLCLDLDFPWGGADTDPAGREAAVDAAVGALTPSALAPFGAVTARGNGLVETCRYWPRTPDAYPGVDRNQELPALARSGPRTLILAGDRDLSTPIVWARATADAMPGSRLVVVPGSGHSVQSRSGSPAAAEVPAFLAQP